MTYSTIIFEKLGAVARITLNRPERANALNRAMLGEIGAALDDAEQDATVRAIVVQGAGAAFSSGFDLKEQMERRPTGIDEWRAHPAQGLRHRDALLALPEADHRRGARALPRRRMRAGAGLRPDDRRRRCLLRRAGVEIRRRHRGDDPAVARRAQDRQGDHPQGRGPDPATSAKEIGIVNRIVPTGDLDEAALALARHIAAIDPGLVKDTKRAINRALEAQGMLEALEEALSIDLAIEGEGSPDKVAVHGHRAPRGLKTALAWRDARFPPLSHRG